MSRAVLPFSFARRQGVLLDADEQGACVWLREGASLTALAEAQRVHGGLLRYHWLDEAQFSQRLVACYASSQHGAEQVAQGMEGEYDLQGMTEQLPRNADLLEQEGDAPIIRLINALLGQAVREQASDVHIETFEQRLCVRFRVDGVLREVLQPPRELATLLVSRVKVMARMDIAEKRVPQDGRIALVIAGHEVDVRVSTLPSAHGERVVMRLLDKRSGQGLSLDKLDLAPANLAALHDALGRPHGIILVTGPTGSGKTTSLYSALADLNDQTRNIMTVEDPIEYHLAGIGQTQVNAKVEMTFARGLRAILRQDPDVVMIGEIRDRETADIAVQASLTGHLVLSTLHTNTAVGAITRLVDIGVEPFLLASSVSCLVAQRLVRRLCPQCKAPGPQGTYQAVGCAQCQGGYRGRAAIYEVVAVDTALRSAIHQGASEQALENLARQHSSSLYDDGVRLVDAGVTSQAELLRVTREH
ncbi:type II secretion system ATPase GspE [Pseudomonas fontis]|uniref:Type II secretion system protein E n=1 Tax=Pseudomonas fontis TaxID=2942633 RepID=A0ABT5NQ50_9PSED|nr:type II secretion system ATPase GspE [Pseudomonas fontis]MDD0972849.1 type II secretion system ATPase GspE [Pseudomonas fontis]MDD0990306.1 type II secretion system ATPase GspE [Pseudomonas fontis]